MRSKCLGCFYKLLNSKNEDHFQKQLNEYKTSLPKAKGFWNYLETYISNGLVSHMINDSIRYGMFKTNNITESLFRVFTLSYLKSKSANRIDSLVEKLYNFINFHVSKIDYYNRNPNISKKQSTTEKSFTDIKKEAMNTIDEYSIVEERDEEELGRFFLVQKKEQPSGGNSSYSISLIPARTSTEKSYVQCTCFNFLFREQVCKHCVMVVLHECNNQFNKSGKTLYNGQIMAWLLKGLQGHPFALPKQAFNFVKGSMALDKFVLPTEPDSKKVLRLEDLQVIENKATPFFTNLICPANQTEELPLIDDVFIEWNTGNKSRDKSVAKYVHARKFSFKQKITRKDSTKKNSVDFSIVSSTSSSNSHTTNNNPIIIDNVETKTDENKQNNKRRNANKRKIVTPTLTERNSTNNENDQQEFSANLFRQSRKRERILQENSPSSSTSSSPNKEETAYSQPSTTPKKKKARKQIQTPKKSQKNNTTEVEKEKLQQLENEQDEDRCMHIESEHEECSTLIVKRTAQLSRRRISNPSSSKVT